MKPEFSRGPARNDPGKEERTMHCESVWELLSAYADKETTPEETAMVEAHIAVCVECARDLAFMQSAATVLNRVDEVEPPAALREAIFAATIHRPRFTERIAALLRRALAPALVRYGVVAAAGAVAALAFAVFHSGNIDLTNPVEYHPAQPKVMAEAPPTPPLQTSRPPRTLPHRSRIAPTTSERQIALRRSHPATVPARFVEEPGVKEERSVPVKRAVAKKATTMAKIERTTPDNKAKVPTVTPSADKPTPDVQPDAMAPTITNAMEKTVVPMTGSDLKAPTGPVATAAAGGITHIQLTSASRTLDAGQVASLADLKRTLRKQSGDWNIPDMRFGGGGKEIRIDVIKGRF